MQTTFKLLFHKLDLSKKIILFKVILSLKRHIPATFVSGNPLLLMAQLIIKGTLFNKLVTKLLRFVCYQ